jgi:hypothetical protein
MSYSISATADTKEDAARQIKERFDAIVVSQPSHAADKEAALAAAGAFIDLLADPPQGHEVYVSMYGSLSWHHETPEEFIAAGCSVSVSLRKVGGI